MPIAQSERLLDVRRVVQDAPATTATYASVPARSTRFCFSTELRVVREFARSRCEGSRQLQNMLVGKLVMNPGSTVAQ